MSDGSNPGKGTRPHKAAGKTFKSRRTKMAMEREANKPQLKPVKSKMVGKVSELFGGLR